MCLSKIMQNFMTYSLLEETLNGCIREFFFFFFTINLFSLTNGDEVLL